MRRRPTTRTVDRIVDAAIIILIIGSLVALWAFATAGAADAAPITRTDDYQTPNVTESSFAVDPVGRWADDVARYFPLEDVDTVLRIIECESGGDPNAKNPTSSASGLLQPLRGWYDGLWWPHTFDPFDPDQNLKYGAKLAAANPGFTDWNASRSCWAGTAGRYSGTTVRVDADIVAGLDGVTITTTVVTVP